MNVMKHLNATQYFVLWIIFLGLICKGCDNGPDPSCSLRPRICVEIIPFKSEPHFCEQVVISYTEQHGTFVEELCGSYDTSEWGKLNPSSCMINAPGTESVTITVFQDEYISASTEVVLAEHNYCGKDIAYVYVILNEDGPPSFSETIYVSPYDKTGL